MIKSIVGLLAFQISLFLYEISPVMHEMSRGTPRVGAELQSDVILKNGWYVLNEKHRGVVRFLKNQETRYFVNPTAVVEVQDFKKLEIIDAQYKGKAYSILIITFSEKGKRNWSEATKSNLGRKMGFILNDQLIIAPKVNMQIQSGLSAINDTTFSHSDILKIKDELEKVMLK